MFYINWSTFLVTYWVHRWRYDREGKHWYVFFRFLRIEVGLRSRRLTRSVYNEIEEWDSDWSKE